MKALTRRVGYADEFRAHRLCTKWGHDWVYKSDGTKHCSRLHCTVIMRYTPNPHGKRTF